MPTYTIKAPTGQNISVTGETPPTEQELDEIFAKVAPAPEAPAPAPQRNLSTAQRLTTGYADLVTPQDQEAAAGMAGKFAAGMASRSGAPAAGQALGAMTGPFAPAAVPILGALGGVIGETGAQLMEDGPMRPGAIVGAGLAGLVPGGSLAKAGVGTLAKEGLKATATNLAATNIETLIDQHRLATATENAFSAGAGIASPIVGKAFDSGMNRPNLRAQQKAVQNAVRDKTLGEAMEAGYVISPSKVNPGGVNSVLESIAGKAATVQESAIRNQEITNALAAKALGLPGDAPLTTEVLKDLRAESGLAYQKVVASAPHAGKVLDQLKEARHEAAVQFKHYDRSADPAALKAGKAAYRDAANLEWRLESIAVGAKQPNLVKDLKAARKTIAQSYEVERALNLGDGNVNASRLAGSIGRLTDELDTIARFNKAFPQFTREAGSVPAPGVSKLKGLTMLASGAGGAAGFGPAGVMLAGIAPLAESTARAGILSRFGQKLLATPSYESNPDFAAQVARQLTLATGRDPFAAK